MTRSRVCLPSWQYIFKCKKNPFWCFQVSHSVHFFLARRKKTRGKKRWISPHALGASILESWRLSQTSPELHQPMLWGPSNAWVHFVQFYDHSYCFQFLHFSVHHLLLYITFLKLLLTLQMFFFLSLVMDVQAFERLLGPCMDIMKRNIANYEEQLVTLFGSSTEIEQQSVRDGTNGPWICGWKKKMLVWMLFFIIT